MSVPASLTSVRVRKHSIHRIERSRRPLERIMITSACTPDSLLTVSFVHSLLSRAHLTRLQRYEALLTRRVSARSASSSAATIASSVTHATLSLSRTAQSPTFSIPIGTPTSLFIITSPSTHQYYMTVLTPTRLTPRATSQVIICALSFTIRECIDEYVHLPSFSNKPEPLEAICSSPRKTYHSNYLSHVSTRHARANESRDSTLDSEIVRSSRQLTLILYEPIHKSHHHIATLPSSRP